MNVALWLIAGAQVGRFALQLVDTRSKRDQMGNMLTMFSGMIGKMDNPAPSLVRVVHEQAGPAGTVPRTHPQN